MNLIVLVWNYLKAKPLSTVVNSILRALVEQGPVLRASGVDIGVVSGVQGISWYELTLLGASAHAGTA